MRRLWVLALLATVVLASCGGGEEQPLATATPGATPTEEASLPLRPDGPVLYVVNADGSGLRELAAGSGYTDFALSPDGRTVAVSVSRFSEQEFFVYLLDVATGQRTEVVRANGASEAVRLGGWSPDGRWLALTVPVVEDGGLGVHLFSVDNETLDRLPVGNTFVAWSPGSDAVFVQQFEPSPALYRVDLMSLQSQQIAVQPGFFTAELSLSPDGRSWAMSSFEPVPSGPGGTSKLILMQPDGSGQRELLTLQETQGFGFGGIAWSPDGDRIAFSRLAFGEERLGGIYTVDIATGELTRGTLTSEGVDMDIAWSPDGERLLVTRRVCTQCDGPGSKPVLAFADGSGETALPGTEQFLFGGLAWSPDGTRFAYGADKLYVASAEGSDARPIVDLVGANYEPVAWAGNDRIVFVRVAALPATAYAVQPDGSDLEVLGVGALSVAPDGETVLGQDGDGPYVRLGDREPVRLHGAALKEAGLTENVTPQLMAWSPDSRWALVAFHPKGGTALAIASRDGEVRVAAPAGWEGEARWSPDGRRFAYWSDGAIWLVDAEGGVPQRLVSAANQPGFDWSPDGSRLAFRVGTDVRLVATDGSSTAAQFLFAVSLEQYSGNTLRWSPDGGHIAVSNGRDLAIGEIETPQVTQLPPQLEIFGLEWSQNGDALIFGARPTDQPNRLGVYIVDASGGAAQLLVESAGRLYAVAGRLADGRIVFVSQWTL